MAFPFAMPNGGVFQGFGAGTGPPAQLSVPGLNMTNGPSGLAQFSAPGIGAQTTYRDNKTIGLQSFESIPTAYIMLLNKKDMQSRDDTRSIGIGEALFIRSNDNTVLQKLGKDAPSYNNPPGQNTAEFKSLGRLNNYLKSMSQYYKTAKDVAREWRFIGVFKNEVAPVNAWNSGNAQIASRMCNVIVSHRVATQNYWCTSGGYLPGTKLYFRIQRKNNVWNITPWCSIDEEFPSDFSSSQEAIIYVGRVGSDEYQAGGLNKPGLYTSLAEQNILGQLQVNIGI